MILTVVYRAQTSLLFMAGPTWVWGAVNPFDKEQAGE